MLAKRTDVEKMLFLAEIQSIMMLSAGYKNIFIIFAADL
jgi:hypothetical protein